jgi:putative nucleic acid modification protein with dual OB domain
MQLVINHLTRMQPGCMCTAGIELKTGLCVRPVLDRQLKIDMLSAHGGPFDIGRIVDLGPTRFVGKLPEVEDQLFEATAARHVGDMPDQAFWALLEHNARDKLGAIFGPDIERIGSTCAVAETYGLRSLGFFWATGGRLFLEDRPSGCKIRFSFQSGDYAFRVPVTDIRLYAADHVTPSEETVSQTAAKVADLPRVLISVGLSRPFRKSPGEPSRHWLQVNNIHLPNEPCWKLRNEFGPVLQ